MANLLDEASILLSATAYDNGSMLAVKPENGDGDFTFSRNSAATRVNAQGLVENVQILSSNLVSNGDFSQEGSQLITNGDFSNGSTDWTLGTGWSIGENNAILNGDGSFQPIRSTSVISNGSNVKAKISVSNLSGILKIGFIGGASMQINQNGVFEANFTSNGGDFYVSRNSGVVTAEITNISVKEVGQDWTVTGTDANNYVEFGDGTARLKFLNTSPITVLLSTAAYENGKKYKLTVDVATLISGSIKVSQSGVNEVFDTIGVSTRIITPTGSGSLSFYRNTSNVDITLNSVSLIEITDDTNLPRINYEGFSYQDSLGSEEVVNGDFATDSDWSKGANTVISSGVATSTTESGDAVSQGITTAIIGKTYLISVDIVSLTLSNITLKFGGVNIGLLNSVGTHSGIITAVSTENIKIINWSGPSWSGSIDNVSVKEYLGQEVVPNSGCGSWLLEPQSTNLITYSEDFSNAYWTKYGTPTIDITSIISPDGTLNGTKVTKGSNATPLRRSNLTTLGTEYTFSLYAKKGSVDTMTLDIGDETNPQFTLTDEWQRFEVTSIPNTSAHVDISFGASVSGDSFYIWGAQVEQNSYPTSYIPTSGATSTRLKDIATNSGNASLINSEEGVLYADFYTEANSVDKWISLSDGTNTNRVIVYISAANTLRIYVQNSSGGQADFASSITLGQYNKVAFKYKENDFSLFLNGVKVGTDTNGGVPIGLNRLNFSNANGTSNHFYGKNKALAVYKTALTDAQLTLLTTL